MAIKDNPIQGFVGGTQGLSLEIDDGSYGFTRLRGGDTMKIQNSQVNMYAHSIDKETVQLSRTTLQLNKQNQPEQAVTQSFEDQLSSLKQEVEEMDVANFDEIKIELSEKEYQRLCLLELIMSRITGKEIRFTVAGNMTINAGKYNGFIHQTINPPKFSIMQTQFSFEKKSELSFDANGVVTTEDGREINFDFNLSRSSHIKYTSQITKVAGTFTDPLALSFDGDLPGLTDEKYSFDIDKDGIKDQISFLTKGSGFLSYDKNNDGVINNGSELFGTESGSGFKDLAAYDEDKNGWIDENDDIFDGLRIWSKDEAGNDHLIALGEKGVGAIYLGAATSQFELLGEDYTTNGIVRESGVYLNENGSVGSVHHLDIRT